MVASLLSIGYWLVQGARQVPFSVKVMMVIFVASLIITLTLYCYTKLRKSASQPAPFSNAEVEQLKQRIAELQVSNQKAEKEIERLKQEAEKQREREHTQSIFAASQKSQLDKYGWLHKMADEQARDVSRHIQAKVLICYHGLDNFPYIVFAVDVDNRSVFDISIDEVTGHVEIGGEPLLEGIRIWNSSVKVSALEKGSVTLKQRLTRSEYDFIVGCRERDEAVFYFDKLVVTSRIDRQDAYDSPQSLSLPKHARYEPKK